VRPKKRLFIGILGLVLLLFFLIGGLVWYTSTVGLSNINYILPYLVGIIFLVFVGIVGIGIVAIVIALCFPAPRLYFKRLIRLAIEFLYPAALRIGSWFGIPKERIEASFIEVNNQLLLSQKIELQNNNLLILAPHCLQKADCPYKITVNIANCHRCGRCPINNLIKLSEKYKVSLAVVTGGTLARKIIKELKPKLVIAIACERDLTSGIQDMYPLPVLGILNERPYGPCFNTEVNLEKVESALKHFLERGNG
jgi:hypothetical protein